MRKLALYIFCVVLNAAFKHISLFLTVHLELILYIPIVNVVFPKNTHHTFTLLSSFWLGTGPSSICAQLHRVAGTPKTSVAAAEAAAAVSAPFVAVVAVSAVVAGAAAAVAAAAAVLTPMLVTVTGPRSAVRPDPRARRRPAPIEGVGFRSCIHLVLSKNPNSKHPFTRQSVYHDSKHSVDFHQLSFTYTDIRTIDELQIFGFYYLNECS